MAIDATLGIDQNDPFAVYIDAALSKAKALSSIDIAATTDTPSIVSKSAGVATADAPTLAISTANLYTDDSGLEVTPGGILLTDSLVLPDGVIEVHFEIERCTDSAKDLWQDEKNETLFILQRSLDGVNWEWAGHVGAFGGITLDKDGKPWPVTSIHLPIDQDGYQYRVIALSQNEQLIKSRLFLTVDQNLNRLVDTPHNSVSYVDKASVLIGLASSASTSTCTVSGTNTYVAASIFWDASRTISAFKFGGSGGQSLSSVSGTDTTDTAATGIFTSPFRLRGYHLVAPSGSGALYAAFNTNTYGAIQCITASNVDQTTPVHTGSASKVNSIADGTAMSMSIASATGELIFYSSGYCAPGAYSSKSYTGGLTERTFAHDFEGAVAATKTSASSSETVGLTWHTSSYYYPGYYYPADNGYGNAIGWSIQEVGGGPAFIARSNLPILQAVRQASSW